MMINDDSHARSNAGSQIRFKTSMLRSIVCDYSDAYILVKGTVIVKNTGTQGVPNIRKHKVIFTNVLHLRIAEVKSSIKK